MRIDNNYGLSVYPKVSSPKHDCKKDVSPSNINFTGKGVNLKKGKEFFKTFFDYLVDPYNAILKRMKPQNQPKKLDAVS